MSSVVRIGILLASAVLYSLFSPAQVLAASVQFVYLSPSDKQYRPEYESALVQAVADLQKWYAGELDGYTFSTPTDPVSWYQLPNTTSWYQTNPPSRPPDNRFFESVLGDAFAITGGKFNDPDNRWIYYIDADHLPGQLVGGNAGVALLPANDLRGLNGEPLVPINPGDPSVNPGFDRWVGGLGHELGHALLLPHPPGSPGGPDDSALMWLGFLDFPDTYLTVADQSSLLSSGFFAKPVPLPSSALLFGSCLFAFAAFFSISVRRRPINHPPSFSRSSSMIFDKSPQSVPSSRPVEM